jgi:hypothetical protein
VATTRIRYFGNEPLKCLRRHVTYVVCALSFTGFFIGLSGVGVWAYCRWVYHEPGILNMAGLLFFLAAFAYFSWFWLLKDCKELLVCRIVPYFQSRIAVYPDNQPDAFSTGVHLARRCRQLDTCAQEMGVLPLSHFGFQDDQDWQTLTWHDPSDGLRTIDALINKMADGKDNDDLLTDLIRLRDNLRRAQAQNTWFCLIVRAGMDKFISPMEMDIRKGHFW